MANLIVFDPDDLFELYQEIRNHNVFPIFLNRYIKSPEHPIGSVLNKIVNKANIKLKAKSIDAIKDCIDSLPKSYSYRLCFKDDKIYDVDNLFKIIHAYLQLELVNMGNHISAAINCDYESSLILKYYPELLDRFDDDGLLIIDNDLKLYQDGVGYKDHVLYVTPFLLRDFMGNAIAEFMIKFWEFYRQTSKINQFRLGIDHTRIVKKEQHEVMLEYDAWYGVPFDESTLDDMYDGVGAKVHTRTRPSMFDLENKLDRTEFLWYSRGGLKHFEVEEVDAPNNVREGFIANRYVHSQRDIGKRTFIHLDGAVRVYEADCYQERHIAQMPKQPRAYKRIKAWRIDGEIDLDTWKELILNYYKGNEMVLEYFNPDEYHRLFDEKLVAYRKIAESD